MPTYTVSAPAGMLLAEQKGAIAQHVTRVHHEATGAQSFFAQVPFVEIAEGDWFMGGVPMNEREAFIQGHIRGGRPADLKHRLVTGLRDALATRAALPANRVWIDLVELPPARMVAYGHVLPEPGGEADWLAGLPAADRALMARLGHRGRSSTDRA